MSSFASAFDPATAKCKNDILAETYGHLAPEKDAAYPMRLVWACGCFGSDDLNPMVLVCESGELESSPWLYDAIQGFISGRKRNRAGLIFEFNGTICNYRFKGKTKLLGNFNREKILKAELSFDTGPKKLISCRF